MGQNTSEGTRQGSRLQANPALVVVLHGCAQTAADYNLGAGWSTLADRYGFTLLLPEQQRPNNPNGCFNWFDTGDIQRGKGEALSIRQMVEKIVVDRGIDRRCVFITGLSAGAAMTSVMLACYPEVFAGGAIIGGVPYGAATNVQQALKSMSHSPARSAQEWGDLVRAAATHERAVAARLRMAWKRRHDGDPIERARNPQTMDECSRSAHDAVGSIDGRRLSSRGLGRRRRR